MITQTKFFLWFDRFCICIHIFTKYCYMQMRLYIGIFTTIVNSLGRIVQTPDLNDED